MPGNCVKVMIIRHAERPQAGIGGVSEAGAIDKQELTARGWQRAGGLVRFFNPSVPAALLPGLAVPGAIFASPATDDNPSRRPLHTVTPLATDLGMQVRKDFAVHQESELMAAALNVATIVLICWHHERIQKLAANLGNEIEPWPDEVFDRVLVFDRAGDTWKPSVVHQHLLPGDT